MDGVGGVTAVLLLCMLFSATSLPLVSREIAEYEDEKCSLCIVRNYLYSFACRVYMIVVVLEGDPLAMYLSNLGHADLSAVPSMKP